MARLYTGSQTLAMTHINEAGFSPLYNWFRHRGLACEIEQKCARGYPRCHCSDKRAIRQEHRLGGSPLPPKIEQIEISEYTVGDEGDRQHHLMVVLRRLAIERVDGIRDERAGRGYRDGLVEHGLVVDAQVPAMPPRIVQHNELVPPFSESNQQGK